MTLTPQQQDLAERQIVAYENKKEIERFELVINGKKFGLEIDPFVATPTIMNSGLQMVKFLEEHSELVKGKIVNDMGTGSGIIGIAAALLGARKVYMEDLEEAAVKNAQKNIRNLGLENICEAFVSDLFSNYEDRDKVEVQIFNHPFMPAIPIVGKSWTRMMFGGLELIGEYFKQAPLYSDPYALYLFPWMPLTNMEDGPDNNPGKRGAEHGFEVVSVTQQEPTQTGMQQYPYEIYILRSVRQ